MTTTSKKPTAISALRQRMIDDMTARKLQPGTQRGHLRGCKRFAIWLGRAPDEASADDVRAFQLHLAETGLSITTRNQTMTGVKFLFRVETTARYTRVATGMISKIESPLDVLGDIGRKRKGKKRSS